MFKVRIPNKNNKKVNNKLLCPYRCSTCKFLDEYLRLKYQDINILTDSEDSFFLLTDEKYHDENNELPMVGKVFNAIEMLAKIDDKVDLIRKDQAKLRRDLVTSGMIKLK